MDFYIAALGRSGSTALANWLTTPPSHVVLHEPNLLGETPTRLLEIQLTEWGMTREQALAGHWAAKEVQTELHHRMIDAFRPAKIVLCVRNIRDAALSLFEKHRLQDSLDRYSDDWAADYMLTEAEGLVRLAERLDREAVPWRVMRHEEFGERSLRALADWLGWPGGGDMARGFEAFGRAFEADRARVRGLPAEVTALATTIGQQCFAFEQRFYGS